MHPADAAQLGIQPTNLPVRLLLQLADGSDCVVPVMVSNEDATPQGQQRAPRGCLCLSRVQQFNLRIASGHQYGFRYVLFVNKGGQGHEHFQRSTH